MTRRSLLTMFAAIPGLAFLASSAGAPPFVGPMTIDRERGLASRGFKVTVFAAGVDVTRRCYFADDTPGHECACLFKHDALGRAYLNSDRSDVARETLKDKIRIVVERSACRTTA